jgi:hypothetical protein
MIVSSSVLGDRMKKKEIKKDDNYLLYLPKRKHENWELRQGKVYLIFNHDKLVERFMRWLVKKPCTSDIELDEIGSAVWQYIDGSTTVYDISKKLSEKYGEDFDPEYKRISKFLNYMNRKGWIHFGKGPQ